MEAISGRFDRNPPLHYEMRIRRVRGELAESPDDLALHDDIAVAFDRLGKSDEALKWIERKRRRMTGIRDVPRPPVAPRRRGPQASRPDAPGWKPAPPPSLDEPFYLTALDHMQQPNFLLAAVVVYIPAGVVAGCVVVAVVRARRRRARERRLTEGGAS